MLKGNAIRAGIEIKALLVKSLQEAYQEENHVNWESEMNAKLLACVHASANAAIDECSMEPTLRATEDLEVPYIKGRIPGTEVAEMIKVAQVMFKGIYPNSTKTANRKIRLFKNVFSPGLRALVNRWNNDAKAYYPNGRPRKNVDGTGAPG